MASLHDLVLLVNHPRGIVFTTTFVWVSFEEKSVPLNRFYNKSIIVSFVTSFRHETKGAFVASDKCEKM